MKYFMISAFGKDKPGIVSHFTGVITSHGGNIEESRMTKLGTEFTMMVLVNISKDWDESLSVALNEIPELDVSIKKTSHFELDANIPQCEIHLSGADNEGLVHKVTEILANKGINIEEIETKTINAPISGTILFNMNARVTHSQLDITRLEYDMTKLAESLGVDIKIVD